jgi:N,N'-diacetyllegionaminate synthase
MVVSTGMSHLGEVDDAVRAIHQAGCNRLVLLHCVSNYPANATDVNLKAMGTMATAFDLPVGYSDHTLGIQVPLAAAALGACVIEKHFTLDRKMPGPDHRASLEPDEFKAMVQGIRTVEQALGNGVKTPAHSEANSRQVVRRSLAAARELPVGTILAPDLLTQLRPANGIPPAMLGQVVGRKARRALRQGELLDWSDLE